MINLKEFKKVSEDKGSATLQHPKGHKITILTSKLTPIQKEALKRLDMCAPERMEKNKENYSEGGSVKRKMYADPDMPVSNEDDAPTTNDSSAPAATAPVTINVGQPNSAMTGAPNYEQSSEQIAPGKTEGAEIAGRIKNPAAVPGLEQEQIGLQQKRDAEIEQAKINAVSQKAYNDKAQELADQDANNLDEVSRHTDDFNKYIQNNKINPNAYMENMGAGQKVTNAIGMLLSGIGGAGPQAMDFLNKQIDRNVASQQQNINNQHTVYNAYLNLYHDKNVAQAMAKASNIDILNNQMKLTAQRLGTAQAWANYNQASGALGIKRSQEVGMAAKTLSGLKNGTIKPSNPIDVNSTPSGNVDMDSESPNIKEKPLIPPDEYADSPILDKNAKGALEDVKYGDEKTRAQYDKFQEAYQNASQADKILGQLHDVHQQMYQDANKGGSEGYLRRHNFVQEIPFIGGAANEALIKPATDNPTNRDYESNKTRIASDVANSLKGTNVGGEEINRIVNANSPEHGDSPADVARKERNIRIFIKNNVAKSNALLETQPGFLYKKKGQ